MDWYSVHIEARAPAGDAALSPAAAELAADALTEALADHHGIATAGERMWSATLSVSASGPVRAGRLGSEIVASAVYRARLPAWPRVRTEAVRHDVLDEDLARPQLPDLVSTGEIAEILSVSPQRVRVLADTHTDFPAPLYELAVGKLYVRTAIERFAEVWDRKPGRPAKAS